MSIGAPSTLYPKPVTNVIELHNNALTIEDIGALGRGVRGNKVAAVQQTAGLTRVWQSMRSLRLSFNGLGPQGAIVLADAIGLNQAIDELWMTDNGM